MMEWLLPQVEFGSPTFHIVLAIFAFIAGVVYALLNPKDDK